MTWNGFYITPNDNKGFFAFDMNLHQVKPPIPHLQTVMVVFRAIYAPS